ncbi:MAG: M28 family peptidase [Myxococcota bacterium]
MLAWWLGLLGLACTTGSPAARQVVSPSQMASPESLRELTQQLADPALDGRDEGSEGSAVVRAFLVEQFRVCGVQPAGSNGYVQPIDQGVGINVLGRIPGTSKGTQAIVVSAHYDHQDPGWQVHPGAQDNAAAVAVLLRLACALAQRPADRDVVIAFWDAEEPPTFLTEAMGSRFWHAHPTVPLTQVGAVIVLDLLGAGLWDGYPGTFALGGETSPQIRAAVASAREPGLPVLPAGLSVVEDLVIGRRAVWSDYEVFRDHNIPVLFMTDGQNKRYHTAADTAEALDYDKLAKEQRWLHQVIRALASGSRIQWGFRENYELNRRSVAALLGAALSAPQRDRWSPTARTSIEAALRSIQDGQASPRDVRAAAQRLMCWSGPQASLFTCSLF